jgi:hypothetical protein
MPSLPMSFLSWRRLLIHLLSHTFLHPINLGPFRCRTGSWAPTGSSYDPRALASSGLWSAPSPGIVAHLGGPRTCVGADFCSNLEPPFSSPLVLRLVQIRSCVRVCAQISCSCVEICRLDRGRHTDKQGADDPCRISPRRWGHDSYGGSFFCF